MTFCTDARQYVTLCTCITRDRVVEIAALHCPADPLSRGVWGVSLSCAKGLHNLAAMVIAGSKGPWKMHVGRLHGPRCSHPDQGLGRSTTQPLEAIPGAE